MSEDSALAVRLKVEAAHPDIRIITPNGELLRQLTLDPSRNYQPQTHGWISTMT